MARRTTLFAIVMVAALGCQKRQLVRVTADITIVARGDTRFSDRCGAYLKMAATGLVPNQNGRLIRFWFAHYLRKSLCSSTADQRVKKGRRYILTLQPQRTGNRLKRAELVNISRCHSTDVRRVVHAARATILRCYTNALHTSTGAKPQGKIVVHWRIGIDGAIDSVSTRHDRSMTIVAKCLQTVIKTLKFKKTNGAVCVVRFPFAFKPPL